MCRALCRAVPYHRSGTVIWQKKDVVLLLYCIRHFGVRENPAFAVGLGETGVSWDTFNFSSNITENIYDIDFELTRQGRGILPLQTLLISYVVTSFVKTEYGINDTCSNCPYLTRHGVGWDSTRGT